MNGQINFGAGRVFILDSGTPKEVGVLKDVSIEYSASQKELRGTNTFPLAIALSGQKLSGKASSGVFNGALIAAIVNGSTATGSKVVATESIAAAASITVDNAATFSKDLGVEDASGVPMTRKPSAPAVGEYSVNESTGVYTFNAAQTGTLKISYHHTRTAGKTVSITSQVQGAPTTFQLVLDENYGGKRFGMKLLAAVINKVSFGCKAEEFSDSGIEFECTADATGNVAEMYHE